MILGIFLLNATLPSELGAIVGVVAGAVFLIASPFLLALSVLSFFVARGLWKGQNWARIIEIIFAIIGGLIAILAVLSGNIGSTINLGINGLIAWYLLFDKKVKKFFS